MDEKTMDDAPVHYGASEAQAWADGYNAAVADLNTALYELALEARAEDLCGDWPAPCNCDDSTTHNGH